MGWDTLLMLSDSERNANMLYAVGVFVPDPFIYLRINNKSLIVLNDMEIDRARKLARHCRVLSLSHCYRRLQDKGVESPNLAQVIHSILRSHGIKKIAVPLDFPYGIGVALRQLDIKVHSREGSFFPQREIKSKEEVKKISAALMMAEVGLAEAIQVLRTSKVGKRGQLLYHDVPLTADKLRSVIEVAILQAGGAAHHTIVAPGRQACDPHEAGHGPLRAHQPIILDIFPRSQKTGYYGDISRTVVKGRASEAVRHLYHTVAEAQKLAFRKMRPGTSARLVHQSVQQFFMERGFKTGKANGCMCGFFHGTGHGLGLEIHEPPRLGLHSTSVLKPGHVVTVEPGLYYPEIGGVRLEDVALVTEKNPRNLTQFEKVLEV
jgi:Xaa-Pro aminopeptidase